MVALVLAEVAMAWVSGYDKEELVPLCLLKRVLVCLCSCLDLLKKSSSSSQIVVVVVAIVAAVAATVGTVFPIPWRLCFFIIARCTFNWSLRSKFSM